MNKKLKQGAAVILATSVLANSIPMSNFIVQAADTIVEFDDENDRGGFQKTSGDGTISFTDGLGEDGYMTLKANGNTIYAETQSQALTDGFVEMDITTLNQARFAIAFRYNSPSDWQGIGCDVGSWSYFTGADQYGSIGASKQSFTTVGEKHHIRIEYRGNDITLYEDGVLIAETTVSAFDATSSGTIGFRLWGYTAGEADYNANIEVDNFRSGELESIATIVPEQVQMAEKDKGSIDYTLTLGQDSPNLVGIMDGTTSLVEGEDYTYSGNTITLKASLFETMNMDGTTLVLSFENEQTLDCPIIFEKEDPIVKVEKDFTTSIEGMEKISSTGSMTHFEESLAISGNGLYIDQESETLKNQSVEFLFDPTSDATNYGVVLRYVDENDYLYVGPAQQHGQHYTSWGVYNQDGLVKSVEDSAFILANRDMPYKVKVKVIDNVVTIYLDNEVIFTEALDISTKAGKVGFRTTGSTGMHVYSYVQETEVKPSAPNEVVEATIASADMQVIVDENFPRIIRYELGTTVPGQAIAVQQVEINNKLYTPTVTSTISGSSARYTLSVAEIGVQFDTVMSVENNTVTTRIENVVENADTLVYTINFPQHSLVSMDANSANAQLRVNNYRGETRSNLNERIGVEYFSSTTLAVLSSDSYAAAVSGGSYKNRKEVAYQTFSNGSSTSTGLWLNEYVYRGLDGEVMTYFEGDKEVKTPYSRVAITDEDRNGDGVIDYQDGAIVLRDDVMYGKIGGDIATDSWNMIAMNVGSEAQYPFLRILDNAKKVSLATDNFAQNIYIKGYQSEGHDAAHPDFADYNERAGGLEDFNILLENSESVNTKMGIHINHTDIYPEAPQYDNLKSTLGGWSWYDSSAQIIRENDMLDTSAGGFDGRLEQLYDTDTLNQLDTTYIDVFFGTRWPMYKLIENINGMDRGMGLGTEYVDEFVSYSTFAHHIGSNFGGTGSLVRFVDHDQADIFANSTLFRGASSRANDDVGINGWQTAKDLDNALVSFYTKILPNKFLAQYPVMIYNSDTQATLGENNEVVTKIQNGVNIITLDGKEVANGNKIFIPWTHNGDSEGKIYHYNQNGGTSTWEIPDSWGSVSEVVVYTLSDEGKANAQTLPVNAGEVSIDAQAGVGYVLYKEEATQIETADTMEWSTGSPVKDMGFDSYNFDEWTPSSSTGEIDHIRIEANNLGNSHLYFTGTSDGKVTQELTGLEVGQTYSASVWAITDEDRNAYIRVDNGEEEISNYMSNSNVVYGVHHNDKYLTNAQRMQVRFVATSETATLTLEAAAGNSVDSVVDFDDVRVTKVDADTKDPMYKYYEDFENVDQGFGVFTSTESDQSHLSQLNPVNPANTPDVIDGTYSLKVRNGDYMRTLPSSVRFDAETEYTVGISYKSGSANAFTFAVKSDKAQAAGDIENAVIVSEAAPSQEGTIEVTFICGPYDDYYVDISSLSASEYYIDNFYVEESVVINVETLSALIDKAKALDLDKYTPESYEEMMQAVELAQAALDASKPVEELKVVYENLDDAIEQLIAYAQTEDRERLQAVIDEMQSILESDYISDANWLTFQTIINQSLEAVSTEKLTVVEVDAQIQAMRDAKLKITPLVSRDALYEILDKAEMVQRGNVVDGFELQTFLSALENAKNVDLKHGVTTQEIADATTTLQAAYDAIVLKDEMKDIMVSDALKTTKQSEAYFLPADWATIQNAASQLSAMQSQEGVFVKDYYAIVMALESAVENKLSTPLVPTSVELDANDFTYTANTAQAAAGNEGPIAFAFDGDEATFWHSAWSGFTVSQASPAIVEIDLGGRYEVNQFGYLQRPTGGENGKIQTYNLYVKNDTTRADWVQVVDQGTFENTAGVQTITFDATMATHVKLEVTGGVGNFAAAAELKVYEKASDFSKLQQLMNDVVKLDKSLYTTTSIITLDAAYIAAESLLVNPATEQATIDATLTQLQEAVDGLIVLANTTDVQTLQTAIENAEAVDLAMYINTEVFEKALVDAKAVSEKITAKEEVTQNEVASVSVELTQAQANLERNTQIVDTTQLAELLQTAKLLETSIYTTSTANTLTTVITDATTLLSLTGTTQDAVDAMYGTLQTAMNNVVLAATVEEKNHLNDAIVRAQAIDVNNYVDTTNFIIALQTATASQAKIASGELSGEEARSVTATMLSALENLVEVPTISVNKDLLLGEINTQIAESEASKYTKGSWEAYKSAVFAANTIYNDIGATQAQVDEALTALQSAKANLVMVEVLPETETTPEGTGNVSTADTTSPIWTWIMALSGMMIAALAVVFKRKKG